MRRVTPIIVVADRALLREGIASLLQHTAYKVVAGAARPAELEDFQFPAGRPKLAIVGIDGKNESLEEAAESIRRLRSLLSDGKIVLVAEANGPIDLQRVLELSPDGYILNLGSRDILIKALELTLMDQQLFVLGRSMATRPHAHGDIRAHECAGASRRWGSYRFGIDREGIQLSHRERQVLTCLAQGESNKTIARLCHISEATAKVHLKAILRKTNAQNRTQAAIWAIDHGFRDAALTHNSETAADAPTLLPAGAP